MNRRKLGIVTAIAVVIALIVVGVVWQRAKSHRAVRPVEAEQGSTYYCPMHPSVTTNKPGNCPICGMKLVKRSGSQQADAATQLASSAKLSPGVAANTLSPTQRALANVKTVQV